MFHWWQGHDWVLISSQNLEYLKNSDALQRQSGTHLTEKLIDCECFKIPISTGCVGNQYTCFFKKDVSRLRLDVFVLQQRWITKAYPNAYECVVECVRRPHETNGYAGLASLLVAYFAIRRARWHAWLMQRHRSLCAPKNPRQYCCRDTFSQYGRGQDDQGEQLTCSSKLDAVKSPTICNGSDFVTNWIFNFVC